MTLRMFPFLMRSNLESVPKQAGIIQTFMLLFVAQARTHTKPPKVKGEEKPDEDSKPGSSQTVQYSDHTAIKPHNKPKINCLK